MREYFRGHIRAGISAARFNARWPASNLALVAERRGVVHLKFVIHLEI